MKLKRIIPILLLTAVLLAGCKMTAYEPVISDFEQSAFVTVGEKEYNCDISMKENIVTVTATSSNAIGLTLIYNGDSVICKYFDLEYEITSDKIDDTNIAKAIYDAFEVIKTEPAKASKTADGFRYDGKTALGDFTVLQYDDYSYKSIEYKDANIKVIFD